MNRLDRALYRLTHDRTVRRAFAAGDPSALELGSDDLAELATVDIGELERLSQIICRQLLRAGAGGDGGLRAGFPRSFASIEQSGMPPLEVVCHFVASLEYQRSRQMPYSSGGISVEEAFYLWLVADLSPRIPVPELENLATHEFLTTLLSLLALNKEPSFQVESALVRWNGIAHVAIRRYPLSFASGLTRRALSPEPDGQVCFLYAAARDRLVRGPIPAGAADPIVAGSRPAQTPLGQHLARLRVVA
jgi:hypothetical protein